MLLNFPPANHHSTIPPCLLLLLPEVCSSPDQAAHYHIPGLVVLKSSPNIFFTLNDSPSFQQMGTPNEKIANVIFMELNNTWSDFESDASQQQMFSAAN
jgi:hypothetical protein